MTELIRATTPTLVKQFVELPYAAYRRYPHWVPPLRRDEHRRLSPKHNPFLEHATITLWLARTDGRITGRIAAIDDRLHDETHSERVTWFGFFEAEDTATSDALLEAVERHGRSRGSTVVRGPVNPSLNESAGLLVDCFDEDPYLLMPYNPPQYAQFVEHAGYEKAKDLLAWAVDLTQPLPDRIAKLADRVRRRHQLVIRPLDLRAFDRDLAIMQGIYRSAWVDNWGFVPPTDAEIRQLAADLKPVLDPEIVLFAELAGRPVACAVTLPDVNQVLKRMHGNLLPFGLWHFLRRRAIVTRVRLAVLGVIPEMRRIGLYPLLAAESYQRAAALGYTEGEMSWTLEDNHLINAGIEAIGGRRHKTYRVYEKPLG
jgi:GNAT superfamily N-acetyltransferase